VVRPTVVRLTPEVAAARRAGQAIVALESSVLVQGLPVPANREAAARMAAAVRAHGAIPAITAVVGGAVAAGLSADELERFLRREGVAKVAARDIPVLSARCGDGATTVSGALLIAWQAGIGVLATGGIGGVHRDAGGEGGEGGGRCVLSPIRDESADLADLARTPVMVICAGAKSILDLPATVERLETLGVTVVGYRTSEFPGFYTAETGIALAHRVDSAEEVVAIWRVAQGLERPGAVLVVQRPPEEYALPRHVVEAAVGRALDEARGAGVRGAGVTPFLLAVLERETRGRTVGANLALLECNAGLAAEVACAVCRERE
jgi:pseudouridine-5'-phosphate glycosidase